MTAQTPYNLKEGTLNSLVTNLGSQLQKAAKHIGKKEAAKAKVEAIAKADAAAKRSASAAKAAKTKKEKATAIVGHTSVAKGINTRPTGLPTIQPVVLNRQQHFESAVGNAKDTPAAKPATPKKDTAQVSIDPSTAYND